MRAVLTCAAVFLLSCGGGSIASGGKCNTSEQCAAGLLCDTTQKPAVCTDKLSNPPPDLASADLLPYLGADLATPISTDMSAVEVDMAAPAHDMAKPPDLATKD